MTDNYASLQEKLLHRAYHMKRGVHTMADPALETEAADAIAALRAECAAMRRTEAEAVAFQVDAWRERVLEAIEPFAEMGEGLSYDNDGVWRRRHHGRVTNLGSNPIEITFNEGEPFERIAALKVALQAKDD